MRCGMHRVGAERTSSEHIRAKGALTEQDPAHEQRDDVERQTRERTRRVDATEKQQACERPTAVGATATLIVQWIDFPCTAGDRVQDGDVRPYVGVAREHTVETAAGCDAHRPLQSRSDQCVDQLRFLGAPGVIDLLSVEERAGQQSE